MVGPAGLRAKAAPRGLSPLPSAPPLAAQRRGAVHLGSGLGPLLQKNPRRRFGPCVLPTLASVLRNNMAFLTGGYRTVFCNRSRQALTQMAGCRVVGERATKVMLGVATAVVAVALLLRLFPSWTADVLQSL